MPRHPRKQSLGTEHYKKILANNRYRQCINTTALNQHSCSKNPHNAKIKKEKWATFTYYGPETKIITRSFKNTNVGIAFKSSNIIKNHVKLTNQIIDIYQKCGVYQLKCNECPLKYIGQTGRSFKDRY
jgi:hypothetical protein